MSATMTTTTTTPPMTLLVSGAPPEFKYIRRFADVSLSDVASVGGKNASLGEMYQSLSDKGVRVPNGYATTADAFREFLSHNGLDTLIRDKLRNLVFTEDGEVEINSLEKTGASIRTACLEAEIPPMLAEELVDAYRELEAQYGKCTDVAVRSSATAEDLPDASFAGQQETYLNVSGIDRLLWTCKKVYASLYTNRAIAYRVHKGYDHTQVALSVGVQKMVRSDKGASGVMFTLDTESGFKDVVLITAAYGLGETVVQGAVNPDEFQVFKPTLKEGKEPIVCRQLGEKAIKMVYATKGSSEGFLTRTINTNLDERDQFCIGDDDVLQLAKFACLIEEHYTTKAGTYRPMDIEWAKDGITNEIFIVQARPETVHSQDRAKYIETYKLREKSRVLCQGKSVGRRIASGNVRVIMDVSEMHLLKEGEILVTDITDPDWEPAMKIASAMITNRGGRTCHAAIVARELGIPAIVGTGNATRDLKNDMEVTVSCADGDIGSVYEGQLHYDVEKQPLEFAKRPDTKIMLNLGDPDVAFEVSHLPCDGVGLARLEFIIMNFIQAHPNALLNINDVPTQVKQGLLKLCMGYGSPAEYYIAKLAEGMGKIAAAFYPKPVIIRFSDFKSNEYATLLGGEQYEPKEENPMIGFRGASRYPSENFANCFRLECQAVKRVRDTMGLKNLAVMVPFVRTVRELINVQKIMASEGLERGKDELKVYLMCEVPSNALLARKFLQHCDGFSIGSNDLTQLTLGVDRDTCLVPGVDEQDEAVMQLMELAIDACNEQGKYVGICGQAPSDFPEITSWLVKKGIKSISLNPDSVLPMTQVVIMEEQNL